MNELVKHLAKYCDITPEDEKAILEMTLIRSYKKGEILLREGSVAKECYFVLKGFIRSFYIKGGEEKTTEFYLEGDVASPVGYGSATPSDHYLQCIEETIACVGTPELESRAFKKYPSLERMSRIMAEAFLSKANQTLDLFKLNTPEGRLFNLMESRPEILQRANQYQVASYLGIQPESLSRIKGRIAKRPGR